MYTYLKKNNLVKFFVVVPIDFKFYEVVERIIFTLIN